MTRINSSVTGIELLTQALARRALGEVDQASRRLATLRQINRASDNPAGLIAAEQIRGELIELEAADRGAARAAAAAHVADSGLAAVSELLHGVQGAVVAAGGNTLSDAERAAYQQEIDAAVEAVNRIGGTTAFNGQNLLDGEAQVAFGVPGEDPATHALPKIHASALGDAAGSLSDLTSGGSASLLNDPARAREIVAAAQASVSSARAGLGAWENTTVTTFQNVFAAEAENLSSALSQIEDADVALESSRLLRGQILANAALGAIQISNTRRRLLADLLGDG